MIATMHNDDEMKRSILIVVLQPDNLERMKRADPVTLETVGQSLGILPVPRYPEQLHVLVAYEEDEVQLYKSAKTGDLLNYLLRGFKFNRDVDGSARAFTIPKEPRS